MAQLLINVLWQARDMDAGFNLDDFGSSCVFVIWTEAQPACEGLGNEGRSP